MKVVLTGFMGTGKSAVGRLLAERLGVRFVDLDDVIEEAAGMPIPEIFASEGEQGFRRREREAVATLAECQDRVIATGGGAVLDPENVRNLRAGAIVVCLTATPETILDRIGSEMHRPLLQVPDRLARIRELLEQRAAAYAQADLCIETSESDVKDIAERIVRHFRLEPAETPGTSRCRT